MCPLPDKAIKLSGGGQGHGKGAQSDLLKPYVIKDFCIGCGLCEYHCPLGGEAAIQVFSYTEAGGFRG
jgi:Pyruvate/2-oxoacid:ferredoxin oxidoreductase delta subunit